jgi:CRISPR-associated protein Cas5d
MESTPIHIEAHFELTARAGPDDTPAKHISMFNRRSASGRCFHRPCLGTREFPADFMLIDEGAPLPDCELPAAQRDRDLGWMLHDHLIALQEWLMLVNTPP